MNSTVDPWTVLGLTPDADGRAVNRAYRRLARRCHPDANPDDPTAAARFRVLVDARAAALDQRGDVTIDVVHTPAGGARREVVLYITALRQLGALTAEEAQAGLRVWAWHALRSGSDRFERAAGTLGEAVDRCAGLAEGRGSVGADVVAGGFGFR